MPPVALVIGAVATVAGTVMSYRGQKKAARAQQLQQAVATRRSRRQAVREMQIRRAQAVASAQASGTLGSSGAAGGIGSLTSQLGSEMGFSTQMSGLSADISSGMAQANRGGAIAGLGGAAMQFGLDRGASFSGLFPKREPRTAQTSAPRMNFGGMYGASAYPSGF
jgi:type II secretory pathway pseudopilin PulG